MKRFVLIFSFDGDDVSIPIASTSGNTPSEVLAAKNGTDAKENKLYYFNPFEQYAENELTGDIASIDPQDDFGDEVSGSGNITPEVKKSKKSKKNKSLKDKIVKAKSEAKEFKKSDDFKKKRKELKDKKQTNGKEEVSFKYLDMALADEYIGGGGYTSPGGTMLVLTGSSTANCGSRIPCYNQHKFLSGSYYYWSGCAPTAMAMVYGYYDRMNFYPDLISGVATSASSDSLNFDPTIKSVINSLRTSMGGTYLFVTGATINKSYYATSVRNENFKKGINYAISKGYTKSTATTLTGITTSTIFTKIKSEINLNKPIVLHLSSSNGKSGHSVVAYGYNNNGTTPIARINMGWGYTAIDGVTGLYYSNVDYNISSMTYNGTTGNYANGYTTINISK